MLTRIEVQGFKNLQNVAVDFGAFTCIAGPNGIGKSNIFDAIMFLAHAAHGPLHEAAQLIRGTTDIRSADPRELFWNGFSEPNREISFAAEMIVPREVEDDLGATTQVKTTFLRYELKLGYEEPEGLATTGRLTLLHEQLAHINKGEAKRHLKFPHSAKQFRNAVVTNERRGGLFLSTTEKDEITVINMHGDGGSYGKPSPRAAQRAGRTILSTVNVTDYPTILAARREMESWKQLALEPSSLRKPNNFHDSRTLAPDGDYLASTLYRIATNHEASGEGHAEDIYARVATRLSELIGIDVDRIEVDLDTVREVFTLYMTERGGLRLPARALSEGTLRFLALCVLLEDPSFTGVICLEEPENGIHPANLPSIVRLVSDIAVDVEEEPGEDNPFRQVIINTHSPGVIQLCDPNEVIMADVRKTRSDDGTPVRALRCLPFKGSWRTVPGLPYFEEGDLIPYLTTPIGAQMSLPADLFEGIS
ncbi:putative ATPase [Arthrobacter woluwensis]|uniref:AAA family ATPase n=1 Tax=Arthrobacter woluwensis TaxID=156980 RepID=UPI0027856EA2|nr:AAA family ATPase [Arthrobacter woluwensis]MDQ0710026.1 putative ATPase [Arthrobacter woluwensis]